jgi:hypothetical protein
MSNNETTLIFKYNPTLKAQALNDIEYYTKLMDDDPEQVNKKLYQLEIDYAKDLLLKIQDDGDIDQKLKLLADKIKQECGKFYNMFKHSKNVLYRGVGDHAAAFESVSPINRKPKDSSQVNSLIFDNKAEELGIIARRSNSIFTTSDKNQAFGYGNVYVIFPKSSADFSWSITYKDMVIHADTNLMSMTLQQFQDKYRLDQTNLEAALVSFHEVLIHGRYIAIKNEMYKDMVKDGLL